MKPFRIKHKGTGMYYKPANGGSNLSITGKLYTRKQPMPKHIRIKIQRYSDKDFLPVQKMIIEFFNLPWKRTSYYFNEETYIETLPTDWEIEYLKIEEEEE